MSDLWPVPISPSQAIYNRNEAQKVRDFQQSMAETQYQRITTSMAAAGLNPILAATGGFGVGGTGAGGPAAMVGSTAGGDPVTAAMQNRLTRALGDKATADARSSSAKAIVDELDASIYTGPDGRALRRGTIGREIGGVVGGAAGYLSGAASSAVDAVRSSSEKSGIPGMSKGSSFVEGAVAPKESSPPSTGGAGLFYPSPSPSRGGASGEF